MASLSDPSIDRDLGYKADHTEQAVGTLAAGTLAAGTSVVGTSVVGTSAEGILEPVLEQKAEMEESYFRNPWEQPRPTGTDLLSFFLGF